jgi:hypothetical protein
VYYYLHNVSMHPRLTLISEADARTIAARWAGDRRDSALALFAQTGQMPGAVLTEIRAVYLRKLARDEEAEVASLGMYLAAFGWFEDVRIEKAARR